jgi:Zn-dependent peptidase ImmA (M78 family)
MTSPGSLGNLCRCILDYEEGRNVGDPVRLGAAFRDCAGIDRTPSLAKTISLVRSLGIRIQAVDYLNTGGTNMSARGCWHIHYSAQDKPATRKFTIFHELFEIIHKQTVSLDPERRQLREPQLSQHADRFAAAALIPPRFFLDKVNASGCDLVKLSKELELSHQCLMIALGQHLSDVPLVSALYEYKPNGGTQAGSDPARNSHAHIRSLICAAVTGGRPLLWRSTMIEDAPIVLVRPLLSAGHEPYRVILLAVSKEDYGMISAQVDRIEPIPVNGETWCPSGGKCRVGETCNWNPRGG